MFLLADPYGYLFIDCFRWARPGVPELDFAMEHSFPVIAFFLFPVMSCGASESQLFGGD